MCPVKILIRLRERIGWFEPSLGAHVRRYPFSICDSIFIVMQCLTTYASNRAVWSGRSSSYRIGGYYCKYIDEQIRPWSDCTSGHSPFVYIAKTRLFEYIENFTTKNWKFSDKNFDIFHISAQNIDCGYSLELPCRQSMFLSRNKKNNVYPCKPQFSYIKVGFKEVRII